MRGFGLIDTAFVARIQLPVSNIPQDNFESYSDGAALNGLNGGSNGTHTYFISWQSAYGDRLTYLGIKGLDTVESYSNGADLNTLNGGSGFSAAYASRGTFLGLWSLDSFEAYSDGAALNGLNAQTTGLGSFTGAYVNHNN